MDKVLTYLLINLSFLYKEFGFVIVDSDHSDQFGGNGLIVLQLGSLFLRLGNDRGQLFLDVTNRDICKKEDWYSSDIVLQLITGKIQDTAVLDESSFPKLFKKHFSKIVDCLTNNTAKENFATMKKMEKERAKRLFG